MITKKGKIWLNTMNPYVIIYDCWLFDKRLSSSALVICLTLKLSLAFIDSKWVGSVNYSRHLCSCGFRLNWFTGLESLLGVCWVNNLPVCLLLIFYQNKSMADIGSFPTVIVWLPSSYWSVLSLRLAKPFKILLTSGASYQYHYYLLMPEDKVV